MEKRLKIQEQALLIIITVKAKIVTDKIEKLTERVKSFNERIKLMSIQFTQELLDDKIKHLHKVNEKKIY